MLRGERCTQSLVDCMDQGAERLWLSDESGVYIAIGGIFGILEITVGLWEDWAQALIRRKGPIIRDAQDATKDQQPIQWILSSEIHIVFLRSKPSHHQAHMPPGVISTLQASILHNLFKQTEAEQPRRLDT